MKTNPQAKEVILTEDEYNELLYKDSGLVPLSKEDLDEQGQREYDRLKEWTEKTGCSVTVFKFPDTDKMKQLEVRVWRLNKTDE